MLTEDATAPQPHLLVPTARIAEEVGGFRFTSAFGLYSIPYEHHLTLKIRFPRLGPNGELPEVPTVSTIWRTADWHEREAYDLMGIRFTGHPDLRRLFLPEDWQGHPLRKEYNEQEEYHGVKVRY